LSQFVNVQKLAFTKLLKKYKKWTRSDNLGSRFKESVLAQPDSISNVDIGPLLDQFLEILQAVRELVQQPPKPRRLSLTPASDPGSKLGNAVKPSIIARYPTSRIQSTIETGSEGDLDVALATYPLGDAGSRAIYWVHPEQVVELKVLLLQHMRPFPAERRRAGKTAPTITRAMSGLSRRDSASSDRVEETHVMVLDDLDAFAQVQSSATIKDAEDSAGGVVTHTAGIGLWTGSSEAHVVVGSTIEGETARSVIVKPKHIGALLDTDSTFERRRSSVQFQPDVQSVDMADDFEQNAKRVREWLSTNPKVKPLVAIHLRRLRFVGLNNDQSQGSWATLNTDITMSRTPGLKEMVGDWWSAAEELVEFPFAVLDVRQEGDKTAELIKFLDDSHLVSHELSPFRKLG